MFLQVDKSWKEIMRKVNRLPNALRAATQPGRSSKVFVMTKSLSFRLSGYVPGLTDFKVSVKTETLSFRLSEYVPGLTELSTVFSNCCRTVEFVTLGQKLNSVRTPPSQKESQKLP